MKKNLVSIMIPTYNRPQMFEQTLKSALAQDYEYVEVLVCDNSTNDDTERLIEKYADNPRLTYRRNYNAKTKAENFAPFEEMAQGEYLQWLMDDDLIMPDKISRMVAVLAQNPAVTLVTSQRGVIDSDTNVKGQWICPFPVKKPYSVYPAEFLIWLSLRDCKNLFGEPSAYLFRRDDLTHHYWQAEAKGCAVISDVAMALELLEKGDAVIFNEPFSFYRRHAGQEGQQIDVILLSRLEWDALNRDYLSRQVCPYTQADYLYFCRKMIKEFDNKFFLMKEMASEKMWSRYAALIESFREKVRRI